MPPETSASPNGRNADALAELLFRVDVPGMELGRFAECSGLSVEWDVLEYAEGGNNEFVHRLRGRRRYPNVVLARGVTNEDALLKWFFDQRRSAQRPTLTVVVLSPAGKDVRRFPFAAAYPVRWSGPQLSAGSDGGGSEALEIAHEGLIG